MDTSWMIIISIYSIPLLGMVLDTTYDEIKAKPEHKSGLASSIFIIAAGSMSIFVGVIAFYAFINNIHTDYFKKQHDSNLIVVDFKNKTVN